MLSSARPALGAAPSAGGYRWRLLNQAAPFPPSYNFPVHRAGNGRFVALHSAGSWSSRDGRSWGREALPFSGCNTGYLATVKHEGAAWALGRIAGDYLHYDLTPVILRTADYRRWETLRRARSPDPRRSCRLAPPYENGPGDRSPGPRSV